MSSDLAPSHSFSVQRSFFCGDVIAITSWAPDVVNLVRPDLGQSIFYETAVCFNYKRSDSGTGGSCSVVLVVSLLVYLMMEAIAA